MDPPSGMGYNPLPLVWSQRERGTTKSEIKGKETGTGEREGSDTEQERSGRNEKGKFLQTECNVTPQRGENDSMERHCQSTRGERAQERMRERGKMKEDLQNFLKSENLETTGSVTLSQITQIDQALLSLSLS